MPPVHMKGDGRKAKNPKKTLARMLSYMKPYMGTMIIVIMDNGMVADVGTHQQLLETSPIYREVYESQKKGGDE